MQTKQMVSTLPSNVARAVMMSSQYKFRMKLINKAKIFGTTIILCKENYTSKTCTNCGNIKHDLGASKIYKCSKCSIILDRDYNGARNIMLRNLHLGGMASTLK